MASSNPALSLGLTYCVRMAWSAAGEPVNRPVLMAPGVFDGLGPGRSGGHPGVLGQLDHPGAGGVRVLRASGITKALPLATANGWPLESLNGVGGDLHILDVGSQHVDEPLRRRPRRRPGP